MRFLLLIFLLISNCSDNKKQTSSNSLVENISLETSTNKIQVNNIPNIDIQNFSFEPVSQEYKDKMDQLERENPDSLVARYDKGLDLVSLESLSKLHSNPIDSIYWDSNHNQYFKIVTTNFYSNIISDFNIEKESQHFFFYKEKESRDKLEYRGAISSNQLVYYDLENKIYIIMFIEPIDDSFIEMWDGESSLVPISNTFTFYPVSPRLYTNNNSCMRWYRRGTNDRLTPIDN